MFSIYISVLKNTFPFSKLARTQDHEFKQDVTDKLTI